jgi:hypothetical protein
MNGTRAWLMGNSTEVVDNENASFEFVRVTGLSRVSNYLSCE